METIIDDSLLSDRAKLLYKTGTKDRVKALSAE